MKKEANMKVKKEYFDYIKSNRKTLEIRVAYPSMQKIGVGTIITWNDDQQCRRKVVRVAQYPNFSIMMEQENHTKMDPEKTENQFLRVLRAIYPKNKELLGVLVFEMEPVA